LMVASNRPMWSNSPRDIDTVSDRLFIVRPPRLVCS
jgi:hypothetical protein